jgi:hypothetical protein
VYLKELRFIRGRLRWKGKLATHAPLVGFHGVLLEWINSAIASLSIFE